MVVRQRAAGLIALARKHCASVTAKAEVRTEVNCGLSEVGLAEGFAIAGLETHNGESGGGPLLIPP